MGPNLFLGECLKADRRHLCHTEEPGCFDSAMSGNDLILGIYKYRIGEAKHADALGNLPDMVLLMDSGIVWVRFELRDRLISNGPLFVVHEFFSHGCKGIQIYFYNIE